MKYIISILLLGNILLYTHCSIEVKPDPSWIKGFDLIVSDKTTGENLIGSVYDPMNVQVLDENGDEQGNIYYDPEEGYIIGDIGCILSGGEEFKIVLTDLDTDTLQTEFVNGTGSLNFYYNNTFVTNVKWDEWGNIRGTDIPIVIVEK